MAEDVRVLHLGVMTVTVVTVGYIQAPYAEWSTAPPSAAGLPQSVRMPVQCFHVAASGVSVLVDASDYHTAGEPAPTEPLRLLAGLGRAGVNPGDVAYVVITHGHGDHFDGLTRQAGGRHVPCFPRARHLLGQADWDTLRPQMDDAASLPSRTLGIVAREGLLDLVDGDRDLGGGVRVLAAPGETPGHLVVRAHGNGQTIYFLGDLYHHALEVEHPAWMTKWNDARVNQLTRQTLTGVALREHALLFATHLPTVGRLHQTAAGVTWDTVYAL